jgi:ABC-2 type transport system ATP-binding protein
VCGIVNPSEGTILANGHDIISEYRAARSEIGLVPQELTTDAFESVLATVKFSRGLFGKPRDPAYLEKVLKQLSLWEKRNDKIMTLSGGMKRRVMIAKALAHEPRILFLDEPTAGVDVELRRGMWELIRELRATGVTVILTTHYIQEAEELADRIGVISRGELILVKEKEALMNDLGRKQLVLSLAEKLDAIPDALAEYRLELDESGKELVYSFDVNGEGNVKQLLQAVDQAGIGFTDIDTRERSLEDIFVDLVKADRSETRQS